MKPSVLDSGINELNGAEGTNHLQGEFSLLPRIDLNGCCFETARVPMNVFCGLEGVARLALAIEESGETVIATDHRRCTATFTVGSKRKAFQTRRYFVRTLSERARARAMDLRQ